MLEAQRERREAEDLKWKEEKAKEKAEEEEEKQRAAAEAAEVARKEQEEFDKWKDMCARAAGVGVCVTLVAVGVCGCVRRRDNGSRFSIEAGGTGDDALQEESQGQLAEFIAHIEQQKVSAAFIKGNVGYNR